MITVFHNAQKVLRIEGRGNVTLRNNTAIGVTLFDLAQQFPDEILVWCNINWEAFLNRDAIKKIFHHPKMMVSYNPYFSNVINDGLGYVDNASILRINKEVSFFTWQMSSVVGAVSAGVLNAVTNQLSDKSKNFDYLLNSIAKRAMPIGLFCYSEPLLFAHKVSLEKGNFSNNYILFKFVKQHYSIKWIIILFLSFLLHERKFLVLPLAYSLFFKKRNWNSNCLDAIEVKSNKKVSFTNEIDVIIPTIGRAKYLKAVLYDLRNQTHLPKKVIIVEQNPLAESKTELYFIAGEKWPFQIEHIFTHKAGACNARNIALSKVQSEWVFLNDDDNEIANDVIEKTLRNCIQYGIEAVVNYYPQKHEKNDFNKVHQTTIFGSGCCIVKKDSLSSVQFNSKYEFAYGEDFDFGMQLRNSGTDVVYFPEPMILHLKAPIGGFRIKPIFEWDNGAILPKPSPTIMLNSLVYKTEQQLFGYKMVYFYSLFWANWKQNPIRFYKRTNAHWDASLYWAKKLQAND
ncbi:glycosyltransferase family 2 protein [Flavobacterium sp. GB2R13]|uniref:glycosyltransferase family 2 protein n=1 Tax=Flavobacterium algoris TaxID=3398733 RepID=UPI003A88B0DF